jgi:hypothetical protein
MSGQALAAVPTEFSIEVVYLPTVYSAPVLCSRAVGPTERARLQTGGLELEGPLPHLDPAALAQIHATLEANPGKDRLALPRSAFALRLRLHAGG